MPRAGGSANDPKGLYERKTSKRFEGPHWQWKHRTGWRDYDQGPSDKIEEAFQKGHPKARLKAGKTGSNPMEVFFADMVQHDASTGNTRDVRRLGPSPWWQRLKRHALSHYYAWDTGLPRTETLETAKARRTYIELAGVGSVGLKFDAGQDLYHSSGLFTNVASSRIFQSCGTFLVALNAIWIAIELDNNDGPTSKVEFQVVENVFCFLFTMEIAIRFAAFKRKVLCIRDSWFCFDSLLVLPMVLDTWLLPLAGILVGNEDGGSVRGDLTVLRVARLLRLSRMIRVLKSMPMMMTLLRGITTSLRPVSIAVGLLLIIIYIFSVLFRSLVDPGGFLEREYFPSVTYTMFFLLMHGTFLDSVGTKGFVINREGNYVLLFLFLIYIFMTSFLMLNMLIGVVCEMVSEVKHGEHEYLAKVTLQSELYDIMDVYDEDGNGTLNKFEFERFIRNVEVMQALHNFNVDIRGLRTLSEMMFSHVSPGDDVALGFDEIMSLAVRLKGTSACRVEDIVKLRDFTKHRLQTLEEHLMTNQRMLEERLRRSLSDPGYSRAPPGPAHALVLADVQEGFHHLGQEKVEAAVVEEVARQDVAWSAPQEVDLGRDAADGSARGAE
jgi:voltage-gated sodium channel